MDFEGVVVGLEGEGTCTRVVSNPNDACADVRIDLALHGCHQIVGRIRCVRAVGLERRKPHLDAIFKGISTGFSGSYQTGIKRVCSVRVSSPQRAVSRQIIEIDFGKKPKVAVRRRRNTRVAIVTVGVVDGLGELGGKLGTRQGLTAQLVGQRDGDRVRVIHGDLQDAAIAQALLLFNRRADRQRRSTRKIGAGETAALRLHGVIDGDRERLVTVDIEETQGAIQRLARVPEPKRGQRGLHGLRRCAASGDSCRTRQQGVDVFSPQ